MYRGKEGIAMSTETVSEQVIVEELHRVPPERWGAVLIFLRSLQSGRQPPTTERPILTGADLLGSDLIGMWADRTDITDSLEFARQLRRKAEHRPGMTDALGH
jgi:hypothetical protein